jgi:hypothetical protein
MATMTRILSLATLLLLSSLAWAQYPLEIIPLRHRSVQEVIPILQPLAEPGATLSGQGYQLFVRTSPANLTELRRALAAIDRAARRLQISVRFDDAMEADRRNLGASGSIGTGGARIEVQADERSTRRTGRVDQQIQVLDGGRATIYTGQSRTLPQRQVIRTPTGVVTQETFVVQERATGFEVVPHVSGDGVQLDIVPQRESGERSERISTRVSARLGEWFELGGASTGSARDQQGLASTGSAMRSETRRIWLKVEALDN